MLLSNKCRLLKAFDRYLEDLLRTQRQISNATKNPITFSKEFYSQHQRESSCPRVNICYSLAQ